MKIRGQVINGSKMGRSLGYPTANISVTDTLDIPNGVYAARVTTADGKQYDAMANLGVKPTFSGSGSGAGAGRVLELHLFNFESDLYGRELTAELLEFIRPEQKFVTPDALRGQISKDEKQIKNVLGLKPSV